MAQGSSPVRLGCALLLVLVVLCSPLLAQIGGLGARQEISVTNPDAQNSAASAVDAYNRDSNSRNYYKLLRIVKAEVQVVGGFNYFLKLELVKTQCEKKGNSGLKHSDLERCAAEQEKLLCEFKLFASPGSLDKPELEYKKCQP